MNARTMVAAVGIFALLGAAGCSERTEQAAQRTTTSAAQDTERNLENAGQAIENTADRAGQAVENTAERASKATQNAAQTMVWTAKVKNALYADDKIAGYKLNVDSDGTKNHVTIMGTVPTQAEKDRITKIARQALGEGAVITNQVKVAK